MALDHLGVEVEHVRERRPHQVLGGEDEKRGRVGGMDRLGAEQFEAHAAENVGEGVAIILVSMRTQMRTRGKAVVGLWAGSGP